MELIVGSNHALIHTIRCRDILTIPGQDGETDCNNWWEPLKGPAEDHITINLITISDAIGGTSGPSNLYHDMAKKPYERVLLARVDIACPHDGQKCLLTPMKHFEYAVCRIKEVAHALYVRNGKPIVLLGWAMGGAAVIEAAFQLQDTLPIQGIITLACQRKYTENLKLLRPSMFKCFLHGSADNCLSASISENLYEDAPFYLNKESWVSVHILPQGDHQLSQFVPHIHIYVAQILKHIEILASLVSTASSISSASSS
jgi:hypothetical protein